MGFKFAKGLRAPVRASWRSWTAYCASAAVAAFALLGPGQASAQAVQPERADLFYQYRSCTVTTDIPIYKEGRSSACGVESTTRYSDSSCPVARYERCEDESHGVDSWRDITTTRGSYPDRWLNGYSSADGCLVEGEAWIARANAGSGGVSRPDKGERYFLIEVNWEGIDNTVPVFGNRISARHRCTYAYGIQRARYAEARSPACDVESRQECRVRTTYGLCRHSTFGVESYKQVTERQPACGLRVEKGMVAVAYEGKLVAQTADPNLSIQAQRRAHCPDAADAVSRHICMRVNRIALASAESSALAGQQKLVADLGKAVEVAADGVLLGVLSEGDMRGQFDNVWNTYLRDKSVGWPDGAASKAFFGDVDTTVERLGDDAYFSLAQRLAVQALTGPPLPGKEDATQPYFSPLYRVISVHDLGRRRVPFNAVADLHVLLNAANPQSSRRMRGQTLLLTEYLARLTAGYVDSRAYDILQLQLDASRVRSNAANVNAAVASVTQRVREMKLPPVVEAAALESLRSATATNQLQSIIRDLIQTARRDIDQTLARTERFVQEAGAKDRLFRVHLSPLHLIRGNVNHAVLQMRESGVAFQQLPKDDDEGANANRSFNVFRRNLAGAVGSSLKRSLQVMEKLRAGSELSPELLGVSASQTGLSYGLMDAFAVLNVAAGDNLDSIRLQLLNHVATNLVGPLQAADAQLKQ